jgi:hypothetical protein
MHQLPSVAAQGIAHQISGKNDSCHGLKLYLTDEFSSTSAGTVLIRDWQGKSHHVTVLDRGTRGLGGGARCIRTAGSVFFGEEPANLRHTRFSAREPEMDGRGEPAWRTNR